MRRSFDATPYVEHVLRCGQQVNVNFESGIFNRSMHEEIRFPHRRKTGKSIVCLVITGVAFRHDARFVFGNCCRETPEKINLRDYSSIVTPPARQFDLPPAPSSSASTAL